MYCEERKGNDEKAYIDWSDELSNLSVPFQDVNHVIDRNIFTNQYFCVMNAITVKYSVHSVSRVVS